MDNMRNQEVGLIVAGDFRTAGIFSRVGIDFCCGGKKSLEESCFEKGIDLEPLEKELKTVMNLPLAHSLNFNEWAIDFLCEYIVNTHHQFVLKKLPELVYYTQKIAAVHGDHHPELREVASLFKKVNDELLPHLHREEEFLFPVIKSKVKQNNENGISIIKAEIDRMTEEHFFAGNAMDTINRLTGNYRIPEDACNTYHVTLKLLKEFEDDLHVHVHLENNILFTKALNVYQNFQPL